MSNYHFGDDYDLNYYPLEASDGMGGVDWDKVERVEIEFDMYVKERTCENVGEETDFSCSECGARLYIEICGDYTMILEDGKTLVTMPNYCPNCGAKVVSE